VPFGSLRRRQRHLTTLHDEEPVILTPVQAPNANAFAEHWVGTVRAECLDWLLIVGRRHLLPARTRSMRLAKAGCTDAICSAVCCTSTSELHE
jgi:hypothetical protein